MIRLYLSILLIGCFCQPCFAAQDEFIDAKLFIHKFVVLSHNYDPALIDMYSDSANICRKVIHKDGNVEEVQIPVSSYKRALKYFRFPAKMRHYQNNYVDLKYKKEGENIRATGIRETTSGYKVPISLLIGKDNSGKMRILEENTETRSVFLIKTVFGMGKKEKHSCSEIK